MPVFVFQLVAKFVDPYTGREGILDREERTSTLFATEEVAKSRIDKFAKMLREKHKVAPDYPIEITVKPYEVIQE